MSHFFEKGDAIYFFCLQLETEARTKWHNFDNNMRLSDRAQDIERWQRELEKTLREVDAEAATLQVNKNNLFHVLIAESEKIKAYQR